MFIQKLCHRDKRGHIIAQIAAFAIEISKFSGGGPPDPLPAATVPATSTSFLIFREVDLPLYAFSYLAPLPKVTDFRSPSPLCELHAGVPVPGSGLIAACDVSGLAFLVSRPRDNRGLLREQ